MINWEQGDGPKAALQLQEDELPEEAALSSLCSANLSMANSSDPSRNAVKGPDLSRGLLSSVAEWLPEHRLTYPGPPPPMGFGGRTYGDGRVSHPPHPFAEGSPYYCSWET